ncbi:MAG: hypothetical protein JXA28_00620 [Bacteroidetes bacterium]|nr:hypothetical protein [Bacteroidota bacterium]
MAESRDSIEQTDQLVQGAVQALSESLDEISAERNDFSSQAGWLKRIDGLFNVSIVFLGVAAPIVVTYLTQQSNPAPDLIRNTILLVAVTGAVAVLRSVLRFGEKYGYTVMTAMKLRELESIARLEMEEIINTSRDTFVYGKLSALNRDVQEKWTQIIRNHLVSGGRGGEGQ